MMIDLIKKIRILKAILVSFLKKKEIEN